MADSVKIYKAYIEAKANRTPTITDLAKSFGITRNALYMKVKEVETGKTKKIEKCTEQSRLECLWKYKYETIFKTIPRDRKASTVERLRKMINDMAKDGFDVTLIARKIKKERSTVIHHIK